MAQEVSVLDQVLLGIVFACMFVSFCVFYSMYRKAPAGNKTFHAYTCGIVGFASTAYLFMTLGDGYFLVDGRVFQYARYIDWLLTTPLLLMDLASLAGVSIEDQVMLIILDVLMILAGFAGSVSTSSDSNLIMWILGIVFFIPIVIDLIFVFPASAKDVGDAAFSTYKSLMWLTVILWTCYPIVYFLAQYGDYLDLTWEIILYGILDVIAKCGFGFILLYSRDSIEEAMKASS